MFLAKFLIFSADVKCDRANVVGLSCFWLAVYREEQRGSFYTVCVVDLVPDVPD